MWYNTIYLSRQDIEGDSVIVPENSIIRDAIIRVFSEPNFQKKSWNTTVHGLPDRTEME